MNYILREGVTYCEASGRLLFLDERRDRYFCLSAAAEAEIRRLASRSTSATASSTMLKCLVDRGLLVPTTGGGRVAPVTSPHIATASLLDCLPSQGPRRTSVIGAGLCLFGVRASLRWRGLAATLNELREIGSAPHPVPDAAAIVAETTAAFELLNAVLSPLDQCLPRSIALARALRRRGLSVSLLIGVKLRPFLAHSWVQSPNLLLNERYDVARSFTPILVI